MVGIFFPDVPWRLLNSSTTGTRYLLQITLLPTPILLDDNPISQYLSYSAHATFSFHSSPPTMTLLKMEIPHVTWVSCHIIIVYCSHFLTPSNPGVSNTQLVLFPTCFHTSHCLLLPKSHGWSTLWHIPFTTHGCTHLSFVVLYLFHRLKAHFLAVKRLSGHLVFISAFMLASKIICDDTYSNKSVGIELMWLIIRPLLVQYTSF